MTSDIEQPKQEVYDYIIVGSGAGGAPLAARLAAGLTRLARKEPWRVLVIEAGSNHTSRGPLDPGNEISRVPLLHGPSTEHEALSWRFFVDHYQRQADGRLPDRIQEDPKWHHPDATKHENETHAGIFYPRAAGIGGCTIHNAMITIAGPDSDWDDLADFVKDDGWRSERMRAYFQRLEHNDYQHAPKTEQRSGVRSYWDYFNVSVRWLFGKQPDLTGGKHGFGGWLHTSVTDLSLGLHDKQLVKMLKAALWQSKISRLDRAWTWASNFLTGRIHQTLDPNHADTQADSPEGVALIPLAVYGSGTTIHQNSATPYAMRGRRSSPRELLLETVANYPDNLTIWTDCLVTKVLLEGDKEPRAVGVELRRGANLYRAHVKPSDSDGVLETVRVRSGGEVILAGGTFNTPQLLMLSGIGDREELAAVRDPSKPRSKGIECKVHLPGVGKNLQDRYEVSVVSQMKDEFSLLDGATLDLPGAGQEPDRHLRRWRNEGTGLYTSNGAVLGIFKRSKPELPKPDLFLFGIPSQFRGYAVGYSRPQPHNLFTWVVLKSHSHNHDGRVRLRTPDPRDTPLINFHSFRTASAPDVSKNDADVLALLEGVKFVRGILSHARSIVGDEVHPGTALVPQNSDEAAKEWIRRDAWGHHACGTCRMGPDGDPDAVLDSRFRVRANKDKLRVAGLRVVDASIFPKIPGYFIVTNIYMASEKAADVILEDAAGQSNGDSATYPAELRRLEAEAIQKRRDIAGPWVVANETEESNGNRRAARDSATVAAVSDCQGPSQYEWSDDVSGLALSGGGIRSATLGLGVIQSLARHHLLRRFDFLSTVSGGGYIGSFLGRCYDRLRPSESVTSRGPQPTNATGPNAVGKGPADRVEEELVDPDSKVIDWLRKHGNYIAPQGRGDGRLNAAVFVRNLLSVHLVVGLAIFSLFGVANLIRYGLFDQVLVGVGLTLRPDELPLGHWMASWFGPFFSPWFMLVDLDLLFLVVPLITGYWIVSQDRHETFKSIPLVLLFGVAGLLLWIGVANGVQWEPVFIALSLLSSLVWVELAWQRGRMQEEALGTGGVETQRLRTRNYLTYDLGLMLALTGGAFVFAVIDTIGHGLHEWINSGNLTYAQAFSALGATLAAAFPTAKLLAGFLSERRPGPPSTIVRLLKRGMMSGGLALLLFALVLVSYSFTAHAVFRGGTAVCLGALITLGTLATSLLLALPGAQSFVNRSSLAQTYGARLARAYLGASNPLRHRPDGINVTEVIPGDDVASIRNYRPHEASGPFHLINLTINQTLDEGSLLRNRDRQGDILAVSCVGMSIGEYSHSAWENGTSSRVGQKVPSGLRPLGRSPGKQHPLVDIWDRPADRAEMLSLRQWIGLSGAAIGSGLGRYTNQGMALLMGLTNLRTGHWWDSGIPAAYRVGFPPLTFVRRCLYLIPRLFTTQSLLISEWIARFPGTWERFWHLSDGGFFENLGVYELIRRRVPRIVVSDGGADPSYQFSDFGELVRKARIDFAARVVSFTPAELADHLPAELKAIVGTVDELRPPRDAAGNVTGPSPKHAALCWVHYPGEARRSVLLYLKATVTGDEPADIRHYHETHEEFPHEATADQFFDEAQWESYRKLGEHLSAPLFAPETADQPVHWFWRITLAPSQKEAP